MSLPFPQLTHSQQNSPAKRRHIEALVAAVREAALNEAAAIFDKMGNNVQPHPSYCAAAIRALKNAPVRS